MTSAECIYVGDARARSARAYAATNSLGRSAMEIRTSRPETHAPTFEEVYKRHFRFVWRTLARRGVRESDLMDVTQNVFIVVHRQLSGFEGRAQLTTWLFSICRLVARDYIRSGPIRREVVVDVGRLTKQQVSSDSPLQHLDARDRGKLLDAVLEKIPERPRVVFVLFELEEMSGDEIARFLDIPVGTVRSRLRIAREIFTREAKVLMRSGSTEGEVGKLTVRNVRGQ